MVQTRGQLFVGFVMFCVATVCGATSQTHTDVLEALYVDGRGDIPRPVLREAINERKEFFKQYTSRKPTFIFANITAQRVRFVKNGQILFDEAAVIQCDADTSNVITININPYTNYMFYADGEVFDELPMGEEYDDYNIIPQSSMENPNTSNLTFSTNKHDAYVQEDSSEDSSGCIYLNNIDILSSLILNWELEAIHSSIAEQTTLNLPVTSPIKLHIVDWKVYFNSEEKVVYK